MADMLDLLLVNASMAVALGLPAWSLSGRVAAAGGWPSVLLLSVLLGSGSQAIIGMLWSRVIGAAPDGELITYLAFWLMVNLLLLARRGRRGEPRARVPAAEGLPLAGLLAAAVAVRSVHPLAHLALGQSDAYNHLNYLRDVLHIGHLHNIVYPPGFSWILALPTRIFHLDPYTVCRFGGAFFGAALVLALYVLVRPYRGRWGALAAAFLVACFPGFNILLKTGVGVFPNQYGILLIPVVLHLALESGREGLSLASPRPWLLVFALAALAATVPMMLLHVCWVLAGAGLLSLAVPGVRRPPFRVALLLFLLPAAGLLVAHFSRIDDRALTETLKAITAGSPVTREALDSRGEETGGLGSYVPYALDYFSLKRTGLGSVMTNSAGAILAALFFLTAAAGVFRRDGFLRLLGVWGLLGVLHVFFGVLQFSNYQREGWSLMMAAAVLGGSAAGLLCAWLERHWWGVAAIGVAAAGVLALSLLRPPGHLFMTSGAEEEIVRFIRKLHDEGPARALRLGELGGEAGAAVEESCLDEGRKWMVVTRQFIQWGLVQALVDRGGDILPGEVRPRTDIWRLFRNDLCYVVIIEKAPLPTPESLAALARVNKPMVESFAHLLERYAETQRPLERAVAHAAGRGWRSVQVKRTPTVEAFVLFYAPPGMDGRKSRGSGGPRRKEREAAEAAGSR